MALSQKHPGKMVVPWFNSNEWKSVKNLICEPESTDTTKKQALAMLQMWKIRMPKLPSGVEGTLIVMEALLENQDTQREKQLRLIYGVSVMRFLNLCGANREKQGTFYQTAKKNDLPDWLIDLRHDIAHDHVVPSLYMLQKGLEFCLDWLKREYWEKQCAIISDYIVNTDSSENLKIVADLYCRINLIRFLNKHVDTIQGILLIEPSLKEGLCAFDELTQIHMDEDVNTVLTKLLEMLHKYIEQQNKLKAANIIADVMILRIISFRVDIELCEDGTERIPSDFINIWHYLINLLYLESMLISLLENIVRFTNSNHDVRECNRKIASLWLTEIFKSLLFAKILNNRYNDMNDKGNSNKETAKAVLEKHVRKRNPDLNGCLNLDFHYYKVVMRSVDSVRIQALSNINEFSHYFLKYLLQVCEETKEELKNTTLHMKSVLPSTCDLSLIGDELHAVDSPKITLANISDCSATPLSISESVNMDVSSPSDNTETVGNNNLNQPKPARRWRIVEDTSIYAGCPLGVLSFQDRNINPALP